MTTRSLTHRVNVPIVIVVPDDPDTLRLIRVLLLVLVFMWDNRHEVLLLIENINRAFDWIDAVVSVVSDMVEAFLDVCQMVYEETSFVVCSVRWYATKIY